METECGLVRTDDGRPARYVLEPGVWLCLHPETVEKRSGRRVRVYCMDCPAWGEGHDAVQVWLAPWTVIA